MHHRASSPPLSAHDLTHVHQLPGRRDAQVTALDHVSVEFPERSFTAVVGASGSGKSTLLHCLAGLEQPTSGEVSMLGRSLTGMKPAARARFRAGNVGFVFQDHNLVPSLTAAQNVALPSRLAGTPLSAERTTAALAAVGLADKADRAPRQLSGGEQQRVAIARVMATRSRIVLADEPTASLDLASGREVLAWLRALPEHSATVVMVTHDVEAATLADSALVMSEGRLVAHTRSRDPREIADLVHATRQG